MEGKKAVSVDPTRNGNSHVAFYDINVYIYIYVVTTKTGLKLCYPVYFYDSRFENQCQLRCHKQKKGSRNPMTENDI